MSTMLAGRYRLLEPLGQGGMGTVWRARDEMLGRDVAVKELTPQPGLSPQGRREANARALREARAAARLDHLAIIKVHDVVDEEDRPWIVMEILTGRPLDAIVRDGPLSPGRAADVGLAMLAALRVAHAEGVLHRDVKPANIFECDDGRIVFTDFGIAAVTGEVSLTRPGALIGSPAYMAPERVRGEPDGPAADLWSLGATLYTLVEGRAPFERKTAMGALSAVLTEEPPPPRLAGPLTPTLLALLSKDPTRRPDAAAVAVALSAVTDGTAPEPQRTAQFPRPARARGVRAGLAVGLAVGSAVVITAAVVLWPGGAGGAGGTRAAPTPAKPFQTISPTCTLLSVAQVSSLYGPVEARPNGARECVWSTVNLGNGMDLTADVDLDAAAPTARMATEPAHDRLLSVSASAGAESTPVRRLPGLAEEAIAFDNSATYATVAVSPSSTVVFRDRNVSVQLTSTQLTPRQPSWNSLAAATLQAARWINQALRNARPSG